MTEKRVALIIASYQYDDAKLRRLVAPAQDAEGLTRALSNPVIGNFEVQTLLNEPSYKVNEAIESFFADRKRDDLLLMYFSGHGIKDEEGKLFLATGNTRRKKLRSTSIPTTFVNEVMRHSRSRRQVLILDCCYSGAFARGMIVRAIQDVGTGEYFGEGRGRVVLTASDAIQYSFEGDEVNGEGVRSVFTHTLVRGLETGKADLDGDGYITFEELYDYVYDRVTDEMPQQEPRKWTFDVKGEIIIARNPNPVVNPKELPPELREVIESPFAEVRVGAVHTLERLLQGSDKALQMMARAALMQLTDDDSRQVSVAAVKSLSVDAETQPKKVKTGVITEAEPPLVIAKRDASKVVIVPETMLVPAGPFLMGSAENNERAEENEHPQHQVELDVFRIGQNPVTNAEYALFIQAGGYENQDYWTEDGWLWRKVEYTTQPKYWKDSLRNPPNHPVVGVSWYEALAYCQWFSETTGQEFRLPSEAEWEKAARGERGPEWPWGNEFDSQNANTVENDLSRTTPVGQYSQQGDSPYGAADMAGNVWEWTLSLWGTDPERPQFKYPYDSEDGRENLEAGVHVLRVLRGGAFDQDGRSARCAYRGRYAPDERANVVAVGFRLMIASGS
jgi:formylglycine-generating enzyme required for sulfatase activity/uncharacterized protein YcfJ